MQTEEQKQSYKTATSSNGKKNKGFMMKIHNNDKKQIAQRVNKLCV